MTDEEQESLFGELESRHETKESDGKRTHKAKYLLHKEYRVDIGQINLNPEQVRKSFRNLESLAQSYQATGGEPLGALPCNVIDGKLWLVAGERRLKAASMAGLTTIRVCIVEVDPLEGSLTENVHRDDLTVVEEAEGYLALKKKRGYTLEELSKKFVKSVSTISDYLVAARLPAEILDMCRDDPEMPLDILVDISRLPAYANKIEVFKLYYENKDRDVLKNHARKSKRKTAHSAVVSFTKTVERLEIGKMTQDEKDLLISDLEKLQTITIPEKIRALKTKITALIGTEVLQQEGNPASPAVGV